MHGQLPTSVVPLLIKFPLSETTFLLALGRCYKSTPYLSEFQLYHFLNRLQFEYFQQLLSSEISPYLLVLVKFPSALAYEFHYLQYYFQEIKSLLLLLLLTLKLHVVLLFFLHRLVRLRLQPLLYPHKMIFYEVQEQFRSLQIILLPLIYVPSTHPPLVSESLSLNSPLPKYARITFSSFCISAGTPSAIFIP